MRKTTIGVLVMAVAFAGTQLVDAQQAPTQKPSPTRPQAQQTLQAPSPAEVRKDIERTLGFMPQFMQAMPEQMLVGFWQSMKAFQMNPGTRLDAKTKELIGLAVAAQIPCEYCTYFHRRAAKAAGASEEEIREAVGMAAMTRMGSTLLNGLEIDDAQFRKDVDQIMRNGRSAQNAPRAKR